MDFKSFLLNENDPMMGGMPGGDPMMGGVPPANDPMMGGGMGGPPMGGMGMDPMGGMGGPPMGGGMGGENPALPQEADVWEVLDSLLNNKPMKKEEKPQQAPPQMGGMNSPSPMGGDMVQPSPHLMQ